MRPSLISCLILLVVGAASAAEVPYGHPDFYPTPERTLGWRANGSGAWPGATPVTSFDWKTKKNVAWRLPMPSPGMNVPLVVGEKVFALADPNILVCANVHTGEILWQTAVDHTLDMPEAQAKECRELIAWYEGQMHRHGKWRIRIAPLLARLGKMKRSIRKGTVMMPGKEHYDRYPCPELEKAMAADPAFKAEVLALDEEMAEYGYDVGTGGNSTIVKVDHPYWKEKCRKLKAYSYHTANSWYGWVTKTYASPCSDGEHVYVQTAQHTVAAVDLDGKIKWITWDRPDPAVYNTGQTQFATRFVLSPLLYRDRFILRADTLLRCYDAKTGEKVWEHYPGRKGKGKRGTIGLGARQSPEAGHHCVVEIPLPDGTTMPAVADPWGWLVRLEDGKVLRDDLPFCVEVASPMGVALGEPGLWYASSYYAVDKDQKGTGKGNVRGKGLKGGWLYRFTAKDRDTVDAELVWHEPACDAVVFRDGQLFGDRRGQRLDLATGTLASGFKTKFPGKYTWTSMGGDYVVRGSPGKGGITYALVDRRSGATAGKGTIVDNRMNEDEEWAWKWKWRGSMGFRNTQGVSFQANRMFVRTMGYLWCIGNPAKRFPVPRGCPDAARVE